MEERCFSTIHCTYPDSYRGAGSFFSGQTLSENQFTPHVPTYICRAKLST